MNYLAGLLLFVVGAFMGLRLPDFDLYFHWWPLIEHRSLLTHGFLIPLLLFASLRGTGLKPFADDRPRLFLMGLCVAMAVHLCFDLFPVAWYGYARVHIPLIGWMGGILSFIWLLISVVVTLYLACKLLRRQSDLGLALLGLITCYGVSAAAQPRFSFFALIMLVPAALAAFLLPRPHHDPNSPAGDISRWWHS